MPGRGRTNLLGSSRGSGTSKSGVKGPGVDEAGESSDCDRGKYERKRRLAASGTSATMTMA